MLIRREWSQIRLRQIGADYFEELPLIETEHDTKLRSTREVGARMCCLFACSAAANDIDREDVLEWLEENGIQDSLSPKKHSFLHDHAPKEQDVINFGWRAEAVYCLLWSVGKLERGLQTEEADIDEIFDAMPDPEEPLEPFFESFELKSKCKILNLSDFLYNAHWTCKRYRDNKTYKIGELNPDAVMEWHKAINWLTCYNDEDNWDEVSTDT